MNNSRLTRKYPLFIPKARRQQQQHLTHHQQPPNSDWESSLSSQTMQAIANARPHYLPTHHSPLLREYDSQDNQHHKSDSLSLGQDSSQFDHLANDFLTEIQLLDYSRTELQEDFKEIVNGHIRFEGIEPVAESQLGHRLVSDGKSGSMQDCSTRCGARF